MAERAETIIVGEVMNERLSRPDLPAYESTIRTVAVLKGNAGDEVTLSQLGFLGSDCSGGPRLTDGERVLLFLRQVQGKVSVVDYEHGKYVLTVQEAKTAYGTPVPVEDALGHVAAAAGAGSEQLDAALALVAESDHGLPTLLIGLAAGGGAVAFLALALVALRQLR